ncbi:MAG: hypothetical protein K6C34_03630 [Alphaproteobacteria bacterium]|nr:hypothetical protein [Alphaproteobacteria bacterium]
MATIEQRVNVALDAGTLDLIKQMAKKAKTSVSKICADLIRRRIEDDEDAYYVRLINEMGDISNKKTISAEEMQRRLDALQD